MGAIPRVGGPCPSMVVQVGGFDNAPCEWCEREEPCLCGPTPCRCWCGRCQYPFPLADDKPAPE